MARTPKISTDDIVKIGSYLWENREELTKTHATDALEKTANAVGVSISYNTFKKMTNHMGLKFARKGHETSSLNTAMKALSEKYNFGEMVTQ